MTEPTIARAALDCVGLGDRAVSYLADGLSSDAWLVEGDGARLVLRIAKHAGQLDELIREHAVLAALSAESAPVPAPVTGSWEHPDWSGPPFSVTTFLAGGPLVPSDAPAIAADIADFLRVLRATPPPDGLPRSAQRFGGAPCWPLHRADLAGHPVEALPHAAERIAALAGDVRRVLAGPDVLVHSDLHEGNILRTGSGSAFLDFGCAFVGSPLWDVAALAFFLGWPVAERVADLDGTQPIEDVRLVALSFALYRWAAAGGDHGEAVHAAAFVDQTLRLLHLPTAG